MGNYYTSPNFNNDHLISIILTKFLLRPPNFNSFHLIFIMTTQKKLMSILWYLGLSFGK